MSLVLDAAQDVRLSALVVLWERWAQTRLLLPYWALVDPATSELKIVLQPA